MTAPSPDFAFARGDVIVVTGAGSGIGRSIAVHAARLGLTVAAWDRNGQAAADTVAVIEQQGGRAVAVIGDIGDPADVGRGFAESRDLGVVRYLVNNAGPASADQLDFAEALLLTVASAQRMVEAWLAPGAPAAASLVNVASVAGNLVGSASGWYSAAKAAVVGYTRHLAVHRASELRSNAVGPGLISTPRLAGFSDSDRGKRVLQQIPLRRLGEPGDVAWLVLFLLSPLAAYVNGAFLTVDGGWTIAN